MVFEGKTQRIIHDRIGQNVVYVTREGCCLYELGMEVEADGLDLKDKRNFSEEAASILREASARAEKRIRKRSPDSDEKSKPKLS